MEENVFYKCKTGRFKDFIFKYTKDGWMDDLDNIYVFPASYEFTKSGMNPDNWSKRNDALRKHPHETQKYVEIPEELYTKLVYYGLVDSDTRLDNVGQSNYSKHFIQPWTVWMDYPELTSWDHDIIKRCLRTKEGTPRKEDYEKIIHICKERIRQIDNGMH